MQLDDASPDARDDAQPRPAGPGSAGSEATPSGIPPADAAAPDPPVYRPVIVGPPVEPLTDYAPPPPRERYWLHLLLFGLTVLTTCAVGAELISNRSWVDETPIGPRLALADLALGLPYSLAFVGFLLTHEMGHYLVARRYGVDATLPFFLPIFIPLFGIQIGTFGAVIRIRETPRTTRQFFDIGIAGPLAGFVVAVAVLCIGFLTLPEPGWLFDLHPEYARDFGRIPTETEILNAYGRADTPEGPVLRPFPALGETLLFNGLQALLANPDRMPHSLELIHYPLLYAGFLALFFTALNLLPIGQLDGGHVVYGLFGRRRAAIISRITVLVLLLYGGTGLLQIGTPNWTLYALGYLLFLTLLTPRIFNTTNVALVLGTALAIILIQQGIQYLVPPPLVREPSYLWLLYAFLGVRLIGLDHPAAAIEQPLDGRRRWLGYAAIVIFVLCFTPAPIVLRTAEDLGQALDPAVDGILAWLR